jgi:hypothetical protein
MPPRSGGSKRNILALRSTHNAPGYGVSGGVGGADVGGGGTNGCEMASGGDIGTGGAGVTANNSSVSAFSHGKPPNFKMNLKKKVPVQ